MAAIHKSTVAIVDDDQRVLESLADLLESAGHAVLLFSSASSLLENDCLDRIDCLIADIGMPVIDGFELQRLAKVARPDLPVILITGRHEIADQRRAAAQGNQGFFRKPFNGQTLLAAVSEAVEAVHRGG